MAKDYVCHSEAQRCITAAKPCIFPSPGLVVLIMGLLLSACGRPPSGAATALAVGAPVGVGGGAYTNVTPAQLSEMLTNKDFIFVNTHIPYEGEIEGTDAFVPFEESGPQRVGEYPADRNSKIVLYCRSGRMSSIVAEELVKAGYTNVWNLDGGMNAWRDAGFTVVER